MPVSVVNAYSGETPFDGSAPYNHNVTITAVTSGNAIIGVVDGSVSAITDNQSGTYTSDDTSPAAYGSTWDWRRRQNITNAPTQIQMERSNSGTVLYAFLEVSGLKASGVLGQTGDGSAGFATNPTVSVTTTTDNEIGLAVLSMQTTRTITPPAGWTMLTMIANQYAVFYNADLGSAGVKTCAPTISSGADCWMSMITYQAEPAASGPDHPFVSVRISG
jgi:hypothetical protein